MWPLTSSWQKKARELEKAGTRFLNYKRDLMSPSLEAEIDQTLRGLRQQRSSGQQAEALASQQRLEELCQRVVPARHQAIRENVEVFFVALVIALAIKSFLVQPFMIPTGSMQPTLNGMKGTPLAEGEVQWNGLERLGQRYLFGRRAVEEVLEEPKTLVGLSKTKFTIPALPGPLSTVAGRFTDWTRLEFADGSSRVVKMPMNTLLADFGLRERLDQLANSQGLGLSLRRSVVGQPDPVSGRAAVGWRAGEGVALPTGTVLARGVLSFGDQVLVNRMAYHFRPPQRGEVFVFMTHGISGLAAESRLQGLDSQHYIKRLAGVPGDAVEVRDGDPRLWVNGQLATEPGLVRVGSQAQTPEGKYGGYVLPMSQAPYQGWPIDRVSRSQRMAVGEHQYLALGDNSRNSADSRYWGPVPEVNLAGPALLAYWPFHSHWGWID